MLVPHSEHEFILQNQKQAELCSLYQERYFFGCTFDCTPHCFYQMCPFRLYIPQSKSYELGAIAILAGKTQHHYEYHLKR